LVDRELVRHEHAGLRIGVDVGAACDTESDRPDGDDLVAERNTAVVGIAAGIVAGVASEDARATVGRVRRRRLANACRIGEVDERLAAAESLARVRLAAPWN